MDILILGSGKEPESRQNLLCPWERGYCGVCRVRGHQSHGV